MSVRLRPYGLPDVLAPTGSESAALDRHAIETLGVPQAVLMENAGRSAAAVVQRLWPEGLVLAVAGRGNNGGDALVLARTLKAWGRSVRVVTVGDRDRAGLLHGWPLEMLRGDELGEDDWTRLAADAAVVVDGVLGTGIRGAPREPEAAAIRRINACGRPVLALDVPSGADADSGAVPGAVVDADATVCFGHPKLGVLLHPARARAGRLLAVEIGFPPPHPEAASSGARVGTPGWAAAHRPARDPDTHKNAVGAVMVVAGSPGMAGAAVLATRGALRAGAGLVRIASPGSNRVVLQAAAPEAIFVDADDREALRTAMEASAAVVVGPGLGRDNAATSLMGAVVRDAGDKPLLIDADGLNIVASGRVPIDEALEGRPVLLTPHPGEMSRLAPAERVDVLRDRPGVARRFADEHRCTVLLKGTPSLVAAPGRPILVDTTGSSALATGGMGDVLSGVAGTFLARGLGPWEAAGVALFTSGRAAALADRGGGLLPTDVVAALPDALAESGNGWTDLDVPGLLFDQDAPR